MHSNGQLLVKNPTDAVLRRPIFHSIKEIQQQTLFNEYPQEISSPYIQPIDIEAKKKLVQGGRLTLILNSFLICVWNRARKSCKELSMLIADKQFPAQA